MTDFCEIQPLPPTHKPALHSGLISCSFSASDVAAASPLPSAAGKAALMPAGPALARTGCFQSFVMTLSSLCHHSFIHHTIYTVSPRHYSRHQVPGFIIKLMKIKLHSPSLTCTPPNILGGVIETCGHTFLPDLYQ